MKDEVKKELRAIILRLLYSQANKKQIDQAITEILQLHKTEKLKVYAMAFEQGKFEEKQRQPRLLAEKIEKILIKYNVVNKINLDIWKQAKVAIHAKLCKKEDGDG